jgi:hypothetical protein
VRAGAQLAPGYEDPPVVAAQIPCRTGLHPWPLSTWSTPGNAKGFLKRIQLTCSGVLAEQSGQAKGVGERSRSIGPPRPTRRDFCRPRAGATRTLDLLRVDDHRILLGQTCSTVCSLTSPGVAATPRQAGCRRPPRR